MQSGFRGFTAKEIKEARKDLQRFEREKLKIMEETRQAKTFRELRAVMQKDPRSKYHLRL